MTISIIIPNFNGKKLLEKNLPLVLKSISETKNVIEVVIVDDGSTDASEEYLKSQKSIRQLADKNTCLTESRRATQKLKVLRNEKNEGFAYSCNRGVKEAQGEIIVLLNNDVVPRKGFLEPLLSHFSNEKVFAVGCKELNGEERGRGVGKFQRGFLVHKRAGNQNKNETLWVSGGSGAFRKDLFIKLGGFDEIYKPFYWEDIDLSYRAQRSGYKVLFEPKSSAYHRHEQTIGRFFNKEEINNISYRNSFIFIWKNITDGSLLLYHFLWLPINLLKAFLTGNKSLIIGFLQALKKLPLILKKRKEARKFSIKKDKEILSYFKDE